MAITPQTAKPLNDDPIEVAVNEIWLEHPGIGIKNLIEKLESRLPPGTSITKQRVKAAKEAVPYRYDDNNDDEATGKQTQQQISKEKIEFVQKKIQERQSLRKERRYAESDRIWRGLEAMGIQLDDLMKTWKVGPVPEKKDEEAIAKDAPSSSSDGVPCEMCGRFFASRNLVFKHLRDPASGCGNNIFASGQSLPDAPSQISKREHKERVFRGISRKSKETEHVVVDEAACLWFGDLPLPWSRFGGKHKRFRAMLREYLPRDVPQPWIRKVVRKCYRDYQNDRAYLGFAILVFRDADEAEMVSKAMDGIQVDAGVVFKDEILNSKEADALMQLPTFVLKVKLDDSGKNANNDESLSSKKEVTTLRPAGLDPPFSDQLLPLNTLQLQERTMRWKSLQGTDHIGSNGFMNHNNAEEVLSDKNQHDNCVDELVALYNIHDPRKFIQRQGRLLPDQICTRLLDILSSLRWPAQNDRPGLTSERYLVLKSNVTNERYFSELSNACFELMQWTDPSFAYSAIAVTKNFVSSPHIDERDQSFQYAVSLGEFDKGGELCVEGRSLDKHGETLMEYVNVVNTHNRVARVDGRHVHWVRTWEGGDRYSLIYYDTREQNATPIIEAGVDETFLALSK